ncbi:MAG: twin-arginine translocase subunit TatC [Actinomycetota bacterium]
MTATDDPRTGAEGVPDDTMTLTEHLAELRVRIIRAGLAVAIGMVLIIAFYEQVLEFLVQPYVDLCTSKPEDFCPPDDELLNAITATEGFSTRIRVGMYGGLILALPVILWQIWRFVVPALEAKEKKYAIPFVLSSVTLFASGGVLAYFTVERALDFLISWATDGVNPVFSVSSYVELVGLMIFAFGVGFLLPVLLVFLQLVDVVTARALLRGWRYAIVGIFCLAAVITPSGDPVTLLLLAGPMIALYFVAVLIGWIVMRRRNRVA